LKNLPKPIEKKVVFFGFQNFTRAGRIFKYKIFHQQHPFQIEYIPKNTYFRAVVLMEKIMNMFYLKLASAQPFKYAKKWKRYDNLTI